MGLKEKTTRGFFWSTVERFGVLGINFVVQILLARIIAPENFGIVATVTILLQILAVLVEGGLGVALVQRKEISRTDISTAFYVNLGISLIVMSVLILCAAEIATYFREPLLEEILPFLALVLCISAAGQTQLQMLVKQLDFKRLASISFPSTLISSIVAIALAFNGFEIWSLVFLRVSYEICNTTLLWLMCPSDIRPNFHFSLKSLKKLAGLSFGVLGSNLLMRITRNLIDLVIAKVFGPEQMAFYNRARFFQKAPTEPIVGMLNRVLFPVFSEIQDENQRIRKSLRSGIPILMFFIAPMMFVLIATAPSLVTVLLTDKWLPAAEYLRVVPLFGITFSLSAIKSNVIRAKGDGRLIFILSLIRNGVFIGVLYLTWQHGIMAMIFGQLACYLFNLVINDYCTSRYIQYPMTTQILDWFFYVVLAAAAALIAFSIELMPLHYPLMVLTLQLGIFSAIYLGVCVAVKANGLTDGLRILSKLVKPENRTSQNSNMI